MTIQFTYKRNGDIRISNVSAIMMDVAHNKVTVKKTESSEINGSRSQEGYINVLNGFTDQYLKFTQVENLLITE